MRAVYVEEFGAPARVADVAVPEPSPRGVVVEVEATGLCRSDWHAWAGHDGGVSLPHIPGHEFVGRIAAVGDEVREFVVGDRVTTPFVCGCGECRYCRAGDAQVCPAQTQPGFTHAGSFAEFVPVENAQVNLVRVPDDVDAAAVASLGCRFATSFRALRHRARVEAGESVAVFGCGGVGLSAVMIAAALGARPIAVDVSDGALTLARRHGAAAVVDASGLTPAQVAARVTEAAGGDGADVALEALGRPATAEAAVRCLRPRGRYVQVGLFATEPVFPIGVVTARELDVLGSHGMAASDYPEMMAMVAGGRLRPQDLVTRTIGLDEVPAALLAMNDGTTPGMTVIRP